MARERERELRQANREAEEYDDYLEKNQLRPNETRGWYAFGMIATARMQLVHAYEFLTERTDLPPGHLADVEREIHLIQQLTEKIIEHAPECESRSTFLRPQLAANHEDDVLLLSGWAIAPDDRKVSWVTFQQTVDAYLNGNPCVPLIQYSEECWQEGQPMIQDTHVHIRFRHFQQWIHTFKRGRNLTQEQLREMFVTDGWEDIRITMKFGKHYKQVYFWQAPIPH